VLACKRAEVNAARTMNILEQAKHFADGFFRPPHAEDAVANRHPRGECVVDIARFARSRRLHKHRENLRPAGGPPRPSQERCVRKQ
jgi:hypothetical protein